MARRSDAPTPAPPKSLLGKKFSLTESERIAWRSIFERQAAAQAENDALCREFTARIGVDVRTVFRIDGSTAIVTQDPPPGPPPAAPQPDAATPPAK